MSGQTSAFAYIFVKIDSATGCPIDPTAAWLQIVAVVSAGAPEFRGSWSQLLAAAICAACLNLAPPSAGFAGNDAVSDGTGPTQLRVWTGPHQASLALEDISGRQVRLEPGGSTISVVHFFATWCEPCRAELPALDRLIARSDPSELRVLAISVAEVEDRIRRFIEKHPIKLQILLDRDRSVARDWQVHTLPTTFILDRDLRPRLFVEHDVDWDTFDATSITRTMSAEKRSDAPAAMTTDTTTGFKGGQP